MIQIETQRLLLRPFELEDTQALFDLNADAEVMQFTGDKAFESLRETQEFITMYQTNYKTGFGRLAIILKTTHECIGWCGLKLHDSGMVDLGYRLSHQHWNKGYATEAAIANLQYGFEILKCSVITGRTAALNIGSVKVLEKIGMQFSKIDECKGIENAHYYTIVVSDWLAQHNRPK